MAKKSPIYSFEALGEIIESICQLESFEFLLFEEENFNELKYKAGLFEIAVSENIVLTDLSFTGHLAVVNYDWSNISAVFSQLDAVTDQDVPVRISVGFNEKESHQSQNGCDSVKVSKLNSELFFGYNANGSKVCSDRAYGQAFISDVIRKLSLPIVLTDEDDFYTLQHANGLKLWLSGGILGRSPTTFSCEIPKIGSKELVELLQEFVESFIENDIYFIDFYVSSALNGEYSCLEFSEKLIKTYNMIRQLNIKTEFDEVDVGIKLTSLVGLEDIRQLCTEDNKVKLLFGADTASENKTVVHIVVTKEGYSLEITGDTQQMVLNKYSM